MRDLCADPNVHPEYCTCAVGNEVLVGDTLRERLSTHLDEDDTEVAIAAARMALAHVGEWIVDHPLSQEDKHQSGLAMAAMKINRTLEELEQ